MIAIEESATIGETFLGSAGQGVTTIHDIPSVADLVQRVAVEYAAACALPPSPALAV